MPPFRFRSASGIDLILRYERGGREVSEIVFGQLVDWPFPSRVSPFDGDTIRSTGRLKFGAKVQKNFDICKFWGSENSKFTFF